LPRSFAALFSSMRPELVIKWIAQAVEVFALLGMAVLLPLSPVASTVLSGDTRHIRQYNATLRICMRMLLALWRTHVIARNTERVLIGPHAMQERIEGSCTHCGRCCVDKTCVFLDWDEQGRSQCSIYNNWFWKLTSCGSYPVNAHSIEVYGCPSFRAVQVRAVTVPVSAISRARGPQQR
jgi:hypothetical protein